MQTTVKTFERNDRPCKAHVLRDERGHLRVMSEYADGYTGWPVRYPASSDGTRSIAYDRHAPPAYLRDLVRRAFDYIDRLLAEESDIMTGKVKILDTLRVVDFRYVGDVGEGITRRAKYEYHIRIANREHAATFRDVIYPSPFIERDVFASALLAALMVGSEIWDSEGYTDAGAIAWVESEEIVRDELRDEIYRIAALHGIDLD